MIIPPNPTRRNDSTVNDSKGCILERTGACQPKRPRHQNETQEECFECIFHNCLRSMTISSSAIDAGEEYRYAGRKTLEEPWIIVGIALNFCPMFVCEKGSARWFLEGAGSGIYAELER